MKMIFTLPNLSKRSRSTDLDPSYKMDLDLGDNFKKKSCLITKEIDILETDGWMTCNFTSF